MKITKTLKTTGLCALALVFTFFILSCQRASKKTGEKLMEKALENATGNKTDVNFEKGKAVIQTGEGTLEVDSKATTWPSEIPGDVPEFKFGRIKAVTTSTMDSTKSWNIVYEGIEDGFLDKYDAQLKEKGFETVLMKIGEKGGSIQAENEKYNVFLMGGEGNMSLAVSLKKQE